LERKGTHASSVFKERLAEIEMATKRKRPRVASGSRSKKVKREEQADKKPVFLDLTIDSD
jgi:hypothetical protein